jgi:SOS-response transcriptional repressor LexA
MGKATAKQTGTLTKRQQRLKKLIADLIAKNGESPSYAEIARKLRIQPSAVFVQVMALESKGHVAVTRGKARSIRVIGEA